MAYKDFDSFDGTQSLNETTTANNEPSMTFDAHTEAQIDLPDASYVRDADIMREGMDLVLDGPEGQITVEGYFAVETPPMLSAEGSLNLSPELVNSFAKSAPEYANNGGIFDESPVGSVAEVAGEATVTRLDGSVEAVRLGTKIYEGDVVETGAEGAVNISFTDETSFAVSQNAKMAIDEYVFDPATESGAQNFSVLKGLFVFTSGLIGRDDPDDVHIETPVGSIGIRGTIIAGDVDNGEITVVEGAIVLKDFDGNEVTLANQFETAKFQPGKGIDFQGQKAANDVAEKFSSVSKVSPNLFSSINDAAAEAVDEASGDDIIEDVIEDATESDQSATEGGGDAQANPDGSVDQNADNQVDGTVEAEASTEQKQSDGEKAERGEKLANEQPQSLDSDGEGDAPAEPAPDPVIDVADSMMGTDTGGLDMAPPPPPSTEPINSTTAEPARHAEPVTSNNQANQANDTVTDVSDGTIDPNIFEDDTGPVDNGPAQVDFSDLDVNSTGFAEADRGGAEFLGTVGADKFTNEQDASRSDDGNQMFHQDISVSTGDGADQLLLKTNAAGQLHVENIKTGDGDDVITFKSSVIFTDLHVDRMDGGEGFDTIKFETTAPGSTLDFSGVNGILDHLNGVEKIDLNDGMSQTLKLTAEMVLQSDNVTDAVGGYTFSGSSDMKTLIIDGNGGPFADNIEFDFDTDTTTDTLTKLSGIGEEGATGYERYEGFYNGEAVRLLVSQDVTVTDVA